MPFAKNEPPPRPTANEAMILPEMQSDLDATVRDIGNLGDIIDGLAAFMTDPGGEDRSAFRMDLLKYKVLHERAVELKGRIIAKMAEAVSDVMLAPVTFQK